MTTNRLHRLWRAWRSTLLLVAVLLSFRSAVADWYDVPTGSMQPTILQGDRIFVDKTAYDWRLPWVGPVARRADPARGDVVVFPSPHDGTRMVKRVLGVPGDVIEMRDNRLLLNGEPQAYVPVEAELAWALPPGDEGGHVLYEEDLDGVRHSVMLTPARRSFDTFGPVTVPEGRYLMIGDNRDNSADSRYFGFVAREAIEGRARGLVMSFDRERRWKPRWDRFFRGLG